MTEEWELTKLRRQVRAKQLELKDANDRLARMCDQEEEARGIVAGFNTRFKASDRRLAEVSPRTDVGVGMAIGFPYWLDPVNHPPELERRKAERAALEQELEAALPVSLNTITQCRRTCEIVRDRIAGELDGLLAQLPEGERCNFGVPADEYVEHRQRVAALRERIGAGS